MWRDQRDATSDVTSCHVRRSAFVSTHKVSTQQAVSCVASVQGDTVKYAARASIA